MKLSQLFNLEGRVALITGGSRGLGLQIAEALGEFGAWIILVSRKLTDLEATRTHLAEQGIVADAVSANLADPAAIDGLLEDVSDRFGTVDILVNNAGAAWGAPAEEHSLEAWNKVFQLNVTGLFLLSQGVGRRFFLPRRRGVILNIASLEGVGAPPICPARSPIMRQRARW